MSLGLLLKQKIGGLIPAKVIESARKIKGSNLNDGVSVALVISDKDENYLKRNKKFLQNLKGDFGVREAMLLVYTDAYKKEIPLYLNKLKELDFFSKEDLNWRHKPTEVLSVFCKKPYDILLDLSQENCHPLTQVIASSEAKLKVCRKGAHNQRFADLIIDISENENEEVFLKTAKQVLSKLSFN